MSYREEYVRGLIHEAVSIGIFEIYRKYSICLIIANVLKTNVALKIDLYSDVGFFRKFLYLRSMLESSNAPEYLGEDLESSDIYKFDDKTINNLFSLNSKLDKFLGESAKSMEFGEINVNFNEVEFYD